MKAVMRTILAAIVLALCATLAAAQFGGGRPFGGGGGYGSGSGNGNNGYGNDNGGDGGQQCNTGCCNLGNQVFKGACASFSNYFRGDANTAISESDSAFQQRVNGAPTPSSSCCVSARSFVQYGCSCNQQLQQAAGQQGFTTNQVSVISRAVQASICANSAHGGSLSTGGC
ncbi:g2664 [Coccomyxa viridis]|uniref:G2664 protein n=1 Tax=Coccomyxa viridis TaxID=1274662 RepID=A0ABP1FSX1_9CHLO